MDQVKGEDVVCVIKNTATLTGSLFTLHASQIRIDLPTLSEKDEEVSHWTICASVYVHLLNDIVAYQGYLFFFFLSGKKESRNLILLFITLCRSLIFLCFEGFYFC